MTSDAQGNASEIALDEKLAEECANWVAEQLTEEYGGFIAAEMIDAVIEMEVEIRQQHSDPEMDHQTMTGHLLERLAEEGAPVDNRWGVTPQLLIEILNLEDEFRGLANRPRRIRGA